MPGPDRPPDPDGPAGPARIRRLDESTIRLIAAGEVVERPASVVKELVENALDAQARVLTVAIEEGGLARIEVADDGGGVPRDDLPLLFQRHATSKLRSASGLPVVRSLGFRGEALASIASVSRVRLTTRTAGEPHGYVVSVDAGSPATIGSAARAPGTTVEVRDLFYQTPARRKFLKTPASEGLRTVQMLQRIYLAHPGIDLTFLQDGEVRFRLPPTADLKAAGREVFPDALGEGAFRFQGSGGPGLWIDGVASPPAFSRGNADGIVLLVNGRPFHSRSLQEGVRHAYRELLPRGRYPVVVVHLKADPSRVDVNVHPTKREVRFQDEGTLRDALQHLLHGALQDQPRPSTLPAATSAPLPFPLPPGPGERSVDPGPVLPLPFSFGGPGLPRDLASYSEPLPPQGDPTRGRTLPATAVHPALRLLGQVAKLYLVAEGLDPPGSLVLVDAHAASERIVYERLKQEDMPAHQDLLVPRDLSLTPLQEAAWKVHGDSLLRLGFRVEPFGEGIWRVRSLPSFRGHLAQPEMLGPLLEELASGNPAAPQEALTERLAKSVACHLAIRGGDVLSLEEMERLLRELYACRESFTCPHGRPIMVTVPRSRLDRWFHRP
jgi:DNA mismatch repair protein MutL